jgi:hypothetical protein
LSREIAAWITFLYNNMNGTTSIPPNLISMPKDDAGARKIYIKIPWRWTCLARSSPHRQNISFPVNKPMGDFWLSLPLTYLLLSIIWHGRTAPCRTRTDGQRDLFSFPKGENTSLREDVTCWKNFAVFPVWLAFQQLYVITVHIRRLLVIWYLQYFRMWHRMVW